MTNRDVLGLFCALGLLYEALILASIGGTLVACLFVWCAARVAWRILWPQRSEAIALVRTVVTTLRDEGGVH